MRRLAIVVGLAIALSGCDDSPWAKRKREAEETRRQEVARDREHATWRAEESRRLLAVCLDVAKFEKQWNNFANWSFDEDTGGCTVEYKKPPAEQKSAKQCADEWLTDKGERIGDIPSATAPAWKRTFYRDCVSDTFSRSWNVQVYQEPTPTASIPAPTASK
jgi:hypothetical protein